jgi:hypothetical protein
MSFGLSGLKFSVNGFYKPYRLYGNEKESRVKTQILGKMKKSLGNLRHGAERNRNQ